MTREDHLEFGDTASSVVLYAHVPKAGGTALSDWLFQQVRSEDSIREEEGFLCSGVFYFPAGYVGRHYPEHDDRIERVLKRPDLKAVIGHFDFGLHSRLTRPARYITVLRDPVDRVVSLFHFHRLVQSQRGSLEGVARLPAQATITDFIANPPYPEVDNGQVRRLAGKRRTRGPCTRAMLTDARRNLKTFSAVGITERLPESCELFRARMGWSRNVPLYAKNVNPSRPNIDHFSEDVLTAIRKQNALDIELYDYAVDLFERALDETC